MRNAHADLRALDTTTWDWAAPGRVLGDPSNARLAAVLVLFGVLDSVPAESTAPVARDLDVLLQRRAPAMGHHAGQISFPGGGVEATDVDMAATAVREAVEETGLDPAGVEVLGALPPLALPVSNNLVTPVLAWWARTSNVAAVDHREAVEVFRMPVADLLDPDNRVTAVFTRGGRDYRSPAFSVRGVVVWGFTALVLDRLFDELGWSVPWDPNRTIPLP
ncbi:MULTISPECIES: CoA pyrophosphatase [unclassified Diaminobutyricimonas]|uniref:NUDIX hydrolase n=1 Tax=unclassified Diaminobutyricimonas TaxID=2643261 RepID=UPI0012F4EA4A|nr:MULTISPECIES: CoA pyrophosphatase [unclassified Diaminobutyricimonas]